MFSYSDYVNELDCELLLPLGATNGLVDLSGNGRHGTAVGGITVGGVDGPLAVGDDGATDFDGVDDFIATTYKTRTNHVPDPGFESSGPTWTGSYLSGTAGTDTTDPYEGSQCGEITSISHASGSGRYLITAAGSAATGQTWMFFIRVRAQGPSDVGKAVTMHLQEANAAGTGISGQANFASVLLTEEWQELMVTRPFVHADTDRITCRVTAISNAFTWDVDTAMLCRIDPYDFHDTDNEVYDTYGDEPNGSPATSDSGQTYLHSYSGGNPDTALRVVSGHLTNILSSGSGSGYAQLENSDRITRMGCKFKFNGTTTGGAIVLIAMVDSIAGGITGGAQNSSFHLVIGPQSWGIQQIDAGAVGSNLASGTYTALTPDTEYTVEILLDDDRAYIQLPTGQMTVVNDPRFALDAKWGVYEVTQTNAATQAKGRFTEIWADSDPISRDELLGPFFPTAEQLASGAAAWSGTAFNSKSHYGCFAQGSVRTFMCWAYRDTENTIDAFFGTSLASGPTLFVGSNEAPGALIDGSTGPGFGTTYTGMSGQWVHNAIILNTVSGTHSYYRNGVLIDTDSSATDFPDFPGDLVLARQNSSGAGGWDGKLALASVHERALTADEISTAFNLGIGEYWDPETDSPNFNTSLSVTEYTTGMYTHGYSNALTTNGD